jgi:hypothetical protein
MKPSKRRELEKLKKAQQAELRREGGFAAHVGAALKNEVSDADDRAKPTPAEDVPAGDGVLVKRAGKWVPLTPPEPSPWNRVWGRGSRAPRRWAAEQPTPPWPAQLKAAQLAAIEATTARSVDFALDAVVDGLISYHGTARYDAKTGSVSGDQGFHLHGRSLDIYKHKLVPVSRALEDARLPNLPRIKTRLIPKNWWEPEFATKGEWRAAARAELKTLVAQTDVLIDRCPPEMTTRTLREYLGLKVTGRPLEEGDRARTGAERVAKFRKKLKLKLARKLQQPMLSTGETCHARDTSSNPKPVDRGSTHAKCTTTE